MPNYYPTCEERYPHARDERVNDLRTLWALYKEDPEANHPELGNFTEYGLCFDFVPAHTFRNQRRGYFRYQISYGGPTEEFRFCTEDPQNQAPIVEFWLLDWDDGYGAPLEGADDALLLEIWCAFAACGTVQAAFEKARL